MRIAAVLIGVILSAVPAEARQIATDLSSHNIEITAGFEGAELLLFGHETNAEDILVIVRGPDQPATIRRKERFAGIWVNQTEVTFSATPGFYYVAVTPGLKADGGLETILAEAGLGARYLGLTALGETQLVETFRKALIELRGRNKLYSTEPGVVQMRPDGLFRVTVPFPASTPVGNYSVTVYQIVDGWPIAGATTPLRVQKAGFSAFVFDLAHGTPFIYGLVAITIALGAGWLGGWAFRRG